MKTQSSSLCRLGVCLIILATLPLSAAAREFTVRAISETNFYNREPAICADGVVAWQELQISGTDFSRPVRSDIIVWRNGERKNITQLLPDAGKFHNKPSVCKAVVVWTASFVDAPAQHPFELKSREKTEAMQNLEKDYPPLFGDVGQRTSRPKPAEETPADAETVDSDDAQAAANDDAPQKDLTATTGIGQGDAQNRKRGGGKEDIALYTADGQVERITWGISKSGNAATEDRYVVWQQERGWPYGYEIMAWDREDKTLIQLTTNYYYNVNPVIHGSKVVWQGWDGHDYEIYMADLESGEIKQITNNQHDDVTPDIWGDELVWVSYQAVYAEIYYYKDGAMRKISDSNEDEINPSIWNGNVVWQGRDETDTEIYFFNGRQTIKLTNNTWDDVEPKIRDGVITWLSYVDNWDPEVMAMDMSDNVIVQLTNNELIEGHVRTAGERIVWQSVDQGKSVIYLAEPTGPRTAPLP